MSTTKKTQTGQERKKNTEYDSAWKEVIEKLFEAFLEFFFLEIHRDIDFSKKPVFLSKELNSIKPYGKIGKRYADELVKVYLKDGSAACICIFIHIEVQGAKAEAGIFEERTYIYNYRIFDKNIEKGIKVISLVILTDEDKKYRPDQYIVNQWGFELRMKFPLVKIIDYKHKKELKDKLETSRNPMTMIVKAQLKSYELKKADNNNKSTVKWELIRQCYERRYKKEQIRALLKFIDWIIRLPEGLDNQISEKIARLEEEYKMPYVTSWERIAEKRGEKRGEEKGKLETARELINNGVDINIIAKATGFSLEEIEKLTETVQ